MHGSIYMTFNLLVITKHFKLYYSMDIDVYIFINFPLKVSFW